MSKLNLVKPQATSFEVNGKEYQLVYDFNAFTVLEREFGTIQKAFDTLSKNPSFTDISKIVLAGLASSENKLTATELGAVLTPREVPALLELVGEALQLAMPEEPKGAKAKN